MRLKTPGTIDNALENVANLRNHLENSRIPMTASGKRDGLLQFIDD